MDTYLSQAYPSHTVEHLLSYYLIGTMLLGIRTLQRVALKSELTELKASCMAMLTPTPAKGVMRCAASPMRVMLHHIKNNEILIIIDRAIENA